MRLFPFSETSNTKPSLSSPMKKVEVAIEKAETVKEREKGKKFLMLLVMLEQTIKSVVRIVIKKLLLAF